MTLTCPGCEHKLAIPDTNPSAVRCKNCKTTFCIEYTEPPVISNIKYPPKVKLRKFKESHPTAVGRAKTGLKIGILAVVVCFGAKGFLENFLENPSTIPKLKSEESELSDAIEEPSSEYADTLQESSDTVKYEEKNVPVVGCIVNMSGNRHPSREKVETAAANGYPNMGPHQTWRVPTNRKVKVVVVDTIDT